MTVFGVGRRKAETTASWLSEHPSSHTSSVAGGNMERQKGNGDRKKTAADPSTAPFANRANNSLRDDNSL